MLERVSLGVWSRSLASLGSSLAFGRIAPLFGVALLFTGCVPSAKIEKNKPLTIAVQAGIGGGKKGFDHAEYDALLKKHVKGDGRVDYAGIKKDHASLQKYLGQLATAPIESLSRDELLALLINTYNAYTLDLIVRNYPVESIKKLSKPWDSKFVKLGGETITLNDVEHKFLRPVELFNDPRMHFAINCASVGCPPLRKGAYTGKGIDAQLAEGVREALKKPRYLKVSGDGVEVSKILDWFKDDFVKKYGTLREFLALHATGRAKELLSKEGVSIGYQSYDWDLNDIPKKG